MEKQRRIKMLSLSAVIVAVLGLTVAFAALSTTLNIKGSAYLDAAKWGIKFQNLSEPSIVGEASDAKTAKIEKDVSINDIKVTLSKPGDSVTYTVDLVNDGDINAKKENIEKTNLTEEQQKYITFTVKYKEDDTESKIGDILSKGQVKPLVIKIEYRKDLESSDLPKSAQEINLSYKLDFVQTDEKATSVSQGNNFKAYSVGDEFCLENECFYVIKDNGTTVDAFAKQNVNTETNRQDSNANALAFAEKTNGSYGYWTDSSGNLLSKYGTKYPAYVFDNNSLLYEPVQNYKTYLKNTLGKTSIDARLITYEELIGLGCSRNKITCKSASSWVYSTDYWSASASSSISVWLVSSNGSFGGYGFVNSGTYGLRPVITISKSDI